MIAYSMRQLAKHLHGVAFRVTVTASAIVAEEWVNLTMRCNTEAMSANQFVVSLGLQLKPPSDENGDDGKVGTVQLCVDKRCIIYQFSRAQSVPLGLGQLLLSPACVFVGFENVYHREILRLTPHQVMLGSNPVDLRMLVMRHHPEVSFCSTETIFKTLLGYSGVRVNEDIFFNSD